MAAAKNPRVTLKGHLLDILLSGCPASDAKTSLQLNGSLWELGAGTRFRIAFNLIFFNCVQQENLS